MKAMIKLMHDHFDVEHLAEVMLEMEELGSPVIHAVDIGDGLYAALEGCHRIRAASELDETVILRLVEYSDDLVDDIIPDWDGDSDITVEDICDNILHIDIVDVYVEIEDA